MRIIKLSRKDEEFRDGRNAVEKFFQETLPNRSLSGKFNVTKRAIGEKGMSPGEELLFSFEGECMYRARASSPRRSNDVAHGGKYPYYFQVSTETIKHAHGTLSGLQKKLNRAGVATVNLHRARSWPVLDLDRRGLRIVDEYLFLEAPDAEMDVVTAEATIKDIAKGQGFLANTEVKSAVEQYAMKSAMDYFSSQKYVCRDCSKTKPYDLYCTRKTETLLVEVKGTTQGGQHILLTAGEVKLAQSRQHEMCLFILHSVKIVQSRGKPEPSGGVREMILPWKAPKDALTSLAFKCNLAGLKRKKSV